MCFTSYLLLFSSLFGFCIFCHDRHQVIHKFPKLSLSDLNFPGLAFQQEQTWLFSFQAQKQGKLKEILYFKQRKKEVLQFIKTRHYN